MFVVGEFSNLGFNQYHEINIPKIDTKKDVETNLLENTKKEYFHTTKSSDVVTLEQNDTKPFKSNIGRNVALTGLASSSFMLLYAHYYSKFLCGQIKKMDTPVEDLKEIIKAYKFPEKIENTVLTYLNKHPNYQEDVINKINKYVKNIKIMVPLSVLLSFGAGFLIDRSNNKKYSEFHNKLKEKDVKTIQKEDKQVQTTKDGNPYYKTSIGKKVALCTYAPVYIIRECFKLSGKTGKQKAISLLYNTAFHLFNGYLIGATLDKIANKSARKHADKVAKAKTEEVK